MKFVVVAALLAVASPALAQTEDTGYPANTTIKGYAKRDRLVIGGLDSVALSQLHEVEGFRGGVGAGTMLSKIRSGGEEDTISSPVGTVNAYYGWEHLTAGVTGSYLTAENKGSEDFSEKFQSRKALPQLAYTFGRSITLGAGVEVNWLDVTESGTEDNKFAYTLQRPIAGLAFHTPKMEFGVTHSGEVQDSTTLSADASREGTLSLAAPLGTENTRAVYLPAETTVYGRGNVTDHVSLMSSVAMSRYDGNVDGSIELFEKYDARDRLAGKVMASYWTQARSRVTLAAEYKGGATSAIGSDETGLGYRLVNTYGGAIEGVLSLNRKTYISLLGGYSRGERDDTSNADVRYSAREESTRVVASMAVKI